MKAIRHELFQRRELTRGNAMQPLCTLPYGFVGHEYRPDGVWVAIKSRINQLRDRAVRSSNEHQIELLPLPRFGIEQRLIVCFWRCRIVRPKTPGTHFSSL